MSLFGVTVRVWPAHPGYRTRVELQSGTVYGRDREFATAQAALVHCAQMLRVLAYDEEELETRG